MPLTTKCPTCKQLELVAERSSNQFISCKFCGTPYEALRSSSKYELQNWAIAIGLGFILSFIVYVCSRFFTSVGQNASKVMQASPWPGWYLRTLLFFIGICVYCYVLFLRKRQLSKVGTAIYLISFVGFVLLVPGNLRTQFRNWTTPLPLKLRNNSKLEREAPIDQQVLEQLKKQNELLQQQAIVLQQQAIERRQEVEWEAERLKWLERWAHERALSKTNAIRSKNELIRINADARLRAGIGIDEEPLNYDKHFLSFFEEFKKRCGHMTRDELFTYAFEKNLSLPHRSKAQ